MPGFIMDSELLLALQIRLESNHAANGKGVTRGRFPFAACHSS